MFKPGRLLVLTIVFMAVSAGYASAATVGVILTNGMRYYEDINRHLIKDVQSRRPGVKFVIERPYPDEQSWSNAAGSLISSGVSAIITYGASATQAAINQHPGVPVIYAGVYAPTAYLLKSKNVAGVKNSLPVASLMRYLKEIVHSGKMGIIYNSREADSLAQFNEIAPIAQEYGIKPAGLNLQNAPDATALLAGTQFNSLFITGCSTAGPVYLKILMMMKERNIPVVSLVYDRRGQPLINLYGNPEDQARLASGLLIAALKRGYHKGKSEDSKKYFLIYDFRESASMGLRTSMELVTDATKVIY